MSETTKTLDLIKNEYCEARNREQELLVIKRKHDEDEQALKRLKTQHNTCAYQKNSSLMKKFGKII